MSTLTTLIRQKIRSDGPLRLDAYIKLCLTHPEYGYYVTRDPLGAGGDFTTAPEISQVFGEAIGLWLFDVWQKLGAPARISLCELGPGRGTLMNDAVRTLKNTSGFSAAIDIFLLDASPKLRAVQAKTLASYAPQWVSDFSALPEQPVLMLANEFFDALPIRQFQFIGGEWKERVVALTPQDTFTLALVSAPDAPTYTSDEGAIAELSPEAVEWTNIIARPLVKHRGAALIIDYGDDEVIGETLQAVSGHRQAHLLALPGHADISAHVSFSPLLMAARKIGCRVYGPAPQGEFLLALGARERTEQLAKSAAEAQQRSLLTGLHRLTDAGQMGQLFKVVALTDKTLPAPLAL